MCKMLQGFFSQIFYGCFTRICKTTGAANFVFIQWVKVCDPRFSPWQQIGWRWLWCCLQGNRLHFHFCSPIHDCIYEACKAKGYCLHICLCIVECILCLEIRLLILIILVSNVQGVLYDKSEVAVKQLKSSAQGVAEFLNEVILITGIRHRNLVKLKGCCLRESQRMLVYEYVENKNLAEALWGMSIFTIVLLCFIQRWPSIQ